MACYSTFSLILIKTVICQIVQRFLVSNEQSADFKRRWNLQQMFQIELGSHKCSYLMKSKNASLHFGEGRGCCPLQTCTLMIIKKIAVAIFFFFFWLRFQNNAWLLHHLRFPQKVFILFVWSRLIIFITDLCWKFESYFNSVKFRLGICCNIIKIRS